MISKVVLALAAFLSVQTAFADAVKHNAAAGRGCIRRISLDEAKAALKRFNLGTTDARNSEIQALGTGLVWMEHLNAGQAHPKAIAPSGFEFRFFDTRGSAQRHDHIRIGRVDIINGTNFGENVAQLIHELAHLIGNQGAYREYFAATNNKICKVSGYSDDVNAAGLYNEQFAEVFAAFVTQPSLIKNNPSQACKDAWTYLSEKFFATGEKAEQCLNGQVELP